LVVSHLTGIPLIEEVNAPLAHEKKIYGSLHFPRLAQLIETLIINGSYRSIAVTEALKKMLVHKGADENNVVVMPNGINPWEYPVNAVGKDTTEVILGFIGWFREWHGLETLVKIFAARKWYEKNVHLLLVGDGPLRGSLENSITRLDLKNHVTITGAVPRNRLGDYLNQIDIALQPAATSYASPMKLIEYMAAGKAIVAPNQPNIKELVVHCNNGLLFEPENVDDMAHQIEKLLLDGVKISQLGCAARKTVEKRALTWDHNAAQVIDLIFPL